MRQRKNKKPGSARELPCIHRLKKGPIQLRVLEEKRDGQIHHLVEILVKNEDTEKAIQIGLMFWQDMQPTMQMMQEASDFIAGRSGMRPLPTVRMYGKTYFVDERLNELHNVEDVSDRLTVMPSWLEAPSK